MHNVKKALLVFEVVHHQRRVYLGLCCHAANCGGLKAYIAKTRTRCGQDLFSSLLIAGPSSCMFVLHAGYFTFTLSKIFNTC